MKKLIISSIALLVTLTFCSLESKAQGETATSGNVALTISIQDAISITLGTSSSVRFEYYTPESFNASPTQTQANHFTVVSNRAYSVGVNATGPFVPAVGATTIPLSTVQISVDNAVPAIPASSSVALSETLTTFVATAPATTGTVFGIDYTIPLAASQALITANATDYTTNVVYTVTQL